MKIVPNLLCRATYNTMNAEYCKNPEWSRLRASRTDGGPPVSGEKPAATTTCFVMRKNHLKEGTDLLRTWTWGEESYFGYIDPTLGKLIASDILRQLYFELRAWYKPPRPNSKVGPNAPNEIITSHEY